MSRVKPSGSRCLPDWRARRWCSLAEPAPKNFVLVDQRQAKAKEEGNTLEKAELKCQEQTRKKGIGFLTAIVRHMRKGAADEGYVACMKERAYEVKP
jgi:hypothetical protein